ncbi:MAG: hypothetical protein Q4A37_00965 [Candidatus Saccharibacteria bacterium]|nr:hypothetical protein [Candidatus Saccharibacteria bacterium]
MPRRNYRQKPPAPRRTPHPVMQQQAACRQKRRFATERLARDAADTQELVNHASLTVYRCQWCDGWHSSSRRTAPRQ